MRRIEENSSAWSHNRANRTTGKQWTGTAASMARYAASRYSKTKGTSAQNMPNHKTVDPRSYTSPEYQNDITARRYEVASWLQDVGGVDNAGAAGLPGSEDQEPAWDGKTVSDGTDVMTEQDLKTAEELEGLEADKEKTVEDQEDEKAESELERLKEMLDTLKQKKADATKSKKRLNYRYQQVSTAIRGAKTVLQASNAVSKANMSLTQIRRQSSSGKYSDNEISIATTHARKMVRTARKKLRNLKSELLQENDGVRAKNDTSQKMGVAVKRTKPQHKLEKQQQKDRELQKLAKEIQAAEAKYKNRHRRNENWELMEADMEYLRRRIALLKNEQEEQQAEYRADTAMETQSQNGEIAADGTTNMFTTEEQGAILQQEAVVETIVKENM